MPWLPESAIEPATVTLVHNCLNVSSEANITITSVMELTDDLKRWVDKEWEQKQKGTSMSLTEMCIPGAISALAAAVGKLDSLEVSLPRKSYIFRDWGVIKDGESTPYPEINTDFDLQATEIQNDLEQIKNVFEWILRIMNLLHDAVEPSFWEEVSRAHWAITEQNLRSSLTHIQSFTTNTPTATVDELIERLRVSTV